jgi:hypothetical protein
MPGSKCPEDCTIRNLLKMSAIFYKVLQDPSSYEIKQEFAGLMPNIDEIISDLG